MSRGKSFPSLCTLRPPADPTLLSREPPSQIPGLCTRLLLLAHTGLEGQVQSPAPQGHPGVDPCLGGALEVPGSRRIRNDEDEEQCQGLEREMGDLPASRPVLESASKAGGRVPEDSLPSALRSLLYKETKQTTRLASPGLTPAEGEAVSFGCLREAAVGAGIYCCQNLRAHHWKGSWNWGGEIASRPFG